MACALSGAAARTTAAARRWEACRLALRSKEVVRACRASCRLVPVPGDRTLCTYTNAIARRTGPTAGALRKRALQVTARAPVTVGARGAVRSSPPTQRPSPPTQRVVRGALAALCPSPILCAQAVAVGVTPTVDARRGAARIGLCVLETRWETGVPLSTFRAVRCRICSTSEVAEGRRCRAGASCKGARTAWQYALLGARRADVWPSANRARCPRPETLRRDFVAFTP